MTSRAWTLGLLMLAVPLSVAAAREFPRAKAIAAEVPATIAALRKCRQIADNPLRLACYDRAVADLDTAITSNDVYVVDKTNVRKARSSLFGLNLPSLGLFAGDSSDSNAVTQIEGVIAAVSQEGYGYWRVTLEDGSVWLQTDDQPLGMSPKPTNKVTIKRGAMASYKMSINGRPSFRVKRVS